MEQGHMNQLHEYKCMEFSCGEYIDDSTLKNYRLIKYYDVNREYDLPQSQ